MYEQYLVLNNLQWLICHKTDTSTNQPTNQKLAERTALSVMANLRLGWGEIAQEHHSFQL